MTTYQRLCMWVTWYGLWSCPLLVCGVLLCDELPNNATWLDLVRAMDQAPAGLALLCPFVIEGDGCPSNDIDYHVLSSLDLYCIPSRRGTRRTAHSNACVVNCTTTRFTVTEYATLRTKHMTLVGARRSAVRVERHGHFEAVATTFHDNVSNQSGGAIYAARSSTVQVQYSTFDGNQAVQGGAIFTEGNLTIAQSNFWYNRAQVVGGVLFGGFSSNITVTDSTMGSNVAGFGGPAIFRPPTMAVGVLNLANNSACDNMIDAQPAGTMNSSCDGVQWNLSSCQTFDATCQLPTAAPTVSPSAIPSRLPTLVPSVSHRPVATSVPPTRANASSVPSNGTVIPTVVPTEMPSVLNASELASSATPTNQPTAMSNATSFPSNSATSMMPTLVPTERPSSSNASGLDASVRPSERPTLVANVSTSNQPSSDSNVTSQRPSDRPTVVANTSTVPSQSVDTMAPTPTPVELLSKVPVAIGSKFSKQPTQTPRLARPSIEPVETASLRPSVVKSQSPNESLAPARADLESVQPSRQSPQVPQPPFLTFSPTFSTMPSLSQTTKPSLRPTTRNAESVIPSRSPSHGSKVPGVSSTPLTSSPSLRTFQPQSQAPMSLSPTANGSTIGVTPPPVQSPMVSLQPLPVATLAPVISTIAPTAKPTPQMTISPVAESFFPPFLPTISPPTARPALSLSTTSPSRRGFFHLQKRRLTAKPLAMAGPSNSPVLPSTDDS